MPLARNATPRSFVSFKMEKPRHLDTKADALAAWQEYQAEQTARLQRMAKQRAMRLAKQHDRPADGAKKAPSGKTSALRAHDSTDQRKPEAKHIEEGYECRGVDHVEAEQRTVNKETRGGKKSGPSRDRDSSRVSTKKGATARGAPSERSRSTATAGTKRGKPTGKQTSKRTAQKTAATAKRAAATRKRRAP